jgi:hypothetical protein
MSVSPNRHCMLANDFTERGAIAVKFGQNRSKLAEQVGWTRHHGGAIIVE